MIGLRLIVVLSLQTFWIAAVTQHSTGTSYNKGDFNEENSFRFAAKLKDSKPGRKSWKYRIKRNILGSLAHRYLEGEDFNSNEAMNNIKEIIGSTSDKLNSLQLRREASPQLDQNMKNSLFFQNGFKNLNDRLDSLKNGMDFTDTNKMFNMMKENIDSTQKKWQEAFNQQKQTFNPSASHQKDLETDLFDMDDALPERWPFKTDFQSLNNLLRQESMFYKKDFPDTNKFIERMKDNFDSASKTMEKFLNDKMFYRKDVTDRAKISDETKDYVASLSKKFENLLKDKRLYRSDNSDDSKNFDEAKDDTSASNKLKNSSKDNRVYRSDFTNLTKNVDRTKNVDSTPNKLTELQLRGTFNSELAQKVSKELQKQGLKKGDIKEFENLLSGRWLDDKESINEDEPEEEVKKSGLKKEGITQNQQHNTRWQKFLENREWNKKDVKTLIESAAKNIEKVYSRSNKVHSRRKRNVHFPTTNDLANGEGKNAVNIPVIQEKPEWKISNNLAGSEKSTVQNVTSSSHFQKDGLHSITTLLNYLNNFRSLKKQNEVKVTNLYGFQDESTLGVTNNKSVKTGYKDSSSLIPNEKVSLQIEDIFNMPDHQRKVYVLLNPLGHISELYGNNKQIKFDDRFLHRQSIPEDTTLNENWNINSDEILQNKRDKLKQFMAIINSSFQNLSPSTLEANTKENQEKYLQEMNTNLMQGHRNLINIMKNQNKKFDVKNNLIDFSNPHAQNMNTANKDDIFPKANSFLIISGRDIGLVNENLNRNDEPSMAFRSFKRKTKNSVLQHREDLFRDSTKQGDYLTPIDFSKIISTPENSDVKILFRGYLNNQLQKQQFNKEAREENFKDKTKRLYIFNKLHPSFEKEIMQAYGYLHNKDFDNSQIEERQDHIKNLFERLLENYEKKTGKTNLQGDIKVKYDEKIFRGPTGKDEEEYLNKIFNNEMTKIYNRSPVENGYGIKSVSIGASGKQKASDYETENNFVQNKINAVSESSNVSHSISPAELYNFQVRKELEGSISDKDRGIRNTSFSEGNRFSESNIPIIFEIFDKKLIEDIIRSKIDATNKRNDFINIMKNNIGQETVLRAGDINNSPHKSSEPVNSENGMEVEPPKEIPVEFRNPLFSQLEHSVKSETNTKKVSAGKEIKEKLTTFRKDLAAEENERIINGRFESGGEQTQNTERTEVTEKTMKNEDVDQVEGKKQGINKEFQNEIKVENIESATEKFADVNAEVAKSISLESDTKGLDKMEELENNDGKLSKKERNMDIISSSSEENVQQLGVTQTATISNANGENESGKTDSNGKLNKEEPEISNKNDNLLEMKTKMEDEGNFPSKVFRSEKYRSESTAIKTSDKVAIQGTNNNSISENVIKNQNISSNDMSKKTELRSEMISVEEPKGNTKTKQHRMDTDFKYTNTRQLTENTETIRNDKENLNTEIKNNSEVDVGTPKLKSNLFLRNFLGDTSFTEDQKKDTEIKENAKDSIPSEIEESDELSSKNVSSLEKAKENELNKIERGNSETIETENNRALEKAGEDINKYENGLKELQSGEKNETDWQHYTTDRPKKKVQVQFKMFRLLGALEEEKSQKPNEPKHTQFKLLKPIEKRIFVINTEIDNNELSPNASFSKNDATSREVIKEPEKLKIRKAENPERITTAASETKSTEADAQLNTVTEIPVQQTDESAFVANTQTDQNKQSANSTSNEIYDSLEHINQQSEESKNRKQVSHSGLVTTATSEEATKTTDAVELNMVTENPAQQPDKNFYLINTDNEPKKEIQQPKKPTNLITEKIQSKKVMKTQPSQPKKKNNKKGLTNKKTKGLRITAKSKQKQFSGTDQQKAKQRKGFRTVIRKFRFRNFLEGDEDSADLQHRVNWQRNKIRDRVRAQPNNILDKKRQQYGRRYAPWSEKKLKPPRTMEMRNQPEFVGGNIQNADDGMKELAQNLDTPIGDSLQENGLESYSSSNLNQNVMANNIKELKNQQISFAEALKEAFRRELLKIGEPLDQAFHKIFHQSKTVPEHHS